MDELRIASKASFVSRHLSLQILTSVEVVLAGPINERIAVDQAEGEFGAEFGFTSGLALFDGGHMGLSDADDTMVNATAAMVIHPLLLPVYFDDHSVC